MKSRLRIAIIGDRGIPARYSGFSNLAEEVATRLVRDHGMDVTVYCRSNYFRDRPRMLRGVRLIYLPAPGGKSFESILHSTVSILHAACGRFDVAFVLDPGNAPFVLPLKLRRSPLLIHTDGLGWQRRKWSPLQRRYYKWSEWVSTRLASWLVTDSVAMCDYYAQEYGSECAFIPYGSRVGDEPVDDALVRFGLSPGRYLLAVARIEPENNTDLLIREYRASGVTMPLIVVGAARYESEYSRRVLGEHDDRVRCVGAVYDSAQLNGLLRHCRLYLHGHEVGGTNPSLLRAMHAGAACVPLDVPFHREVLGESVEYFSRSAGSLAGLLRRLDADDRRVHEIASVSRQRAGELYRWDAVAAAYADLFERMRDIRRSGRSYRALSGVRLYRPETFEGAERSLDEGAP